MVEKTKEMAVNESNSENVADELTDAKNKLLSRREVLKASAKGLMIGLAVSFFGFGLTGKAETTKPEMAGIECCCTGCTGCTGCTSCWGLCKGCGYCGEGSCTTICGVIGKMPSEL